MCALTHIFLEQMSRIKPTGVPVPLLQSVGKALHTVPEGFTLHPIVKKTLQMKEKMFAGEEVHIESRMTLVITLSLRVDLLTFSLLTGPPLKVSLLVPFLLRVSLSVLLVKYVCHFF